MSATGLVRTQYWNVSGPNPTPLTGSTSRAESRTDVEGYLIASDMAGNAALHIWGVATGLEVSAVTGSAGITVAPGTALDVEGRVVVLAPGGAAIVDPLVGPTGVQNIPTVPVTGTGVTLDTADLAGSFVLTLTWREVEEAAGGLLILRQTPWLRLVDPTSFVDDGLQLMLAELSLGLDGVVDALTPGQRRLVSVPAARLELRTPGSGATGLTVGQVATAELAPRDDGGVDLRLLAADGSARRALSVTGGSADVELEARLTVGGETTLAAGLTVGGDSALEGGLSVSAGVEVAGDLRAASTTVATLAVQGDATVGAGADGVLTVRRVNGKHFAGDTSDDLFLNWDTGRAVRVGGGAPADLQVSRNVFVGGRVGVKTADPKFDVHVDGTVCATTFCNPSDVRLKSGVADLVGVLDGLGDVRAVTFTPVPDRRDDVVRRRAGVLAQELRDPFPELVVPMGSDGMLAVDYAGLAAVLVGAVNELRSAGTDLESRVGDLERRREGGEDDRPK